MTMKKALVIALICINVGLLTALIMVNNRSAKAQVIGGGRDYLMVTAKYNSSSSAVWVLDLARRRMLAWRVNKTSKRLEPYRGRSNLNVDFGRRSDR